MRSGRSGAKQGPDRRRVTVPGATHASPFLGPPGGPAQGILAKASSLPQSSAIGTPQHIRAYHEVSLMERTDQLGDELGYRPRFMVIGGEPASVLLEVAEGHTGSSLISVGRRGLGFLARWRIGGVSTKLLGAFTGPLLISSS